MTRRSINQLFACDYIVKNRGIFSFKMELVAISSYQIVEVGATETVITKIFMFNNFLVIKNKDEKK